MSYTRVIPRDLFNEANLLKCYAQIYINLENMNVDASLIPPHDNEGFEIIQDEDTGSTSIENVKLIVGDTEVELFRPLNSRESWPLIMRTENEDEIYIFEDDGSFTPEMTEFLNQFPQQERKKTSSLDFC